MDVNVPGIPAEYDAYRAELRAFIVANRPALKNWKQRAGLRVPELAEDIAALRAWVRLLFDNGYRLQAYTADVLDRYEQRILQAELAATGIPYVLGNTLVSGALKIFGTPEQQARLLGGMATGEHIWTQLFSEPDAGSDLTSLRTRGRLDGDHYVITGQKVWSTWAQWADYGYLLARTEPVDGSKGITAFALDMRAPGVEVRPLREMTGTTDFNEVFLDEVRIPVTDVIGRPGEGWLAAGASLATERTDVGSGGDDGSTLGGLINLARRHKRRGSAAIDDAQVRQQIGSFIARSRIQRALGYRAATKAQTKTSEVWEAPLAKIWFSELNLELVEYAMTLQGARSMLVEGDEAACNDGIWQDRFLYARAWTIAGGSNEIMRNMIAEKGLGLPREPRG